MKHTSKIQELTQELAALPPQGQSIFLLNCVTRGGLAYARLAISLGNADAARHVSDLIDSAWATLFNGELASLWSKDEFDEIEGQLVDEDEFINFIDSVKQEAFYALGYIYEAHHGPAEKSTYYCACVASVMLRILKELVTRHLTKHMTFQEHADLIQASPAVIQEYERRDRDYVELMNSCTIADARTHMERAREEASTFFADTPQEWLSEPRAVPGGKPTFTYDESNQKFAELVRRMNPDS